MSSTAEHHKIHLYPLLFSALVFTLYLGIGFARLYAGHPAEDAYILFKYIENLARGQGIVYYTGGPHAEGYVDFLWIAVLAGFVRLGADVAAAAICVNGFGAALSAWLFIRTAENAHLRHTPAVTLLFFFPFLILIHHASLAGYACFSTTIYAALVLLVYHLSLSENIHACLAIPTVSLIVGLTRADGALIAAGFGLVGLVHAARKKILGRYILLSLAAAAAGGAYFAWRYRYFGLLLPLPLYVKSVNGLVNGVESNLEWLLQSQVSPLPGVAGLAVLFILMIVKKKGAHAAKMITSFLPLALLGAALCFANQIQNIYWRFQAPIGLVVWYMLFRSEIVLLQIYHNKKVQLIFVLCLYAAVIPALSYGIKEVEEPPRRYLDTFAALMGRDAMEGRVFATTEAGRPAYWFQGRVEDAMGLNSPAVAKGASLDYFRGVDPDVILFQHGGIVDPELLAQGNKDILESVSSEKLVSAVNPSYMEKIRNGRWRELKLDPDPLGCLFLVDLLTAPERYDIYAVLYPSTHKGTNYWHIYGFKKGLPEKEKIVRDLERTLNGYYQSYADLKHFPGSSPAQGIK